VDACTDHANPGRARLALAKVLLGLVQRVLWGFHIIVVPPCVAREYTAMRGSSALGSMLGDFTPPPLPARQLPPKATEDQVAAAAKIGQYL
jgi:hypothetical protein